MSHGWDPPLLVVLGLPQQLSSTCNMTWSPIECKQVRGDARCTQHYCWCTQQFKWMGKNALHLKFKPCNSSHCSCIRTVLTLRRMLFFSAHSMTLASSLLEREHWRTSPVVGGSFFAHQLVPLRCFCNLCRRGKVLLQREWMLQGWGLWLDLRIKISLKLYWILLFKIIEYKQTQIVTIQALSNINTTLDF